MVERTDSSSRPDGSTPEEPVGRMAPGVVVDGRYEIVSHLGEGGMGTVLIAEHLGLGRRVALKVLQERIGDDPTMRKRFQREARTLAAMSHPNIVAMNDYGIWEGMPYLVMELLSGRTLRELLDAEPLLTVERALEIVQQVLRALAYAQTQGVVHRDLKPGNVFLQALPDQIDHVKLLDFGFAKFVHQPTTSFVSAEGIIVGTPAYMAPEQAGGVVDHRADVYAAAVLLFEMLSGRRPFEGDPLAMIRGRMTMDPPTLAEARPGHVVAPELEQALARALARRPEDRYQSASELAAALVRVPRDAVKRAEPRPLPAKKTPVVVESERPPAPRRRGRALVWSVLALGSLVGIGYAGWRASSLASTSSNPPSSEPASAEPSEEVPVELEAPPEASVAVAPRVDPPRAEPIAPEDTSTRLVEAALVLAEATAIDALPIDAEEIAAPPSPDPLLVPEAALVEAPATTEDAEALGAEALEAVPDPIVTSEPSDPWAREIPPALLALRARVDQPRAPSTADLQRIGTYARHNPGDARALVLLGHGYVRARWMSEALERYADAHAVDAEVRGDPRMRANLVALATSTVVGARAGELVITIYGEEALPMIDAALAAEGIDAEGERRLRALRAAITSR